VVDNAIFFYVSETTEYGLKVGHWGTRIHVRKKIVYDVSPLVPKLNVVKIAVLRKKVCRTCVTD
jgi:hypothetical protein